MSQDIESPAYRRRMQLHKQSVDDNAKQAELEKIIRDKIVADEALIAKPSPIMDKLSYNGYQLITSFAGFDTEYKEPWNGDTFRLDDWFDDIPNVEQICLAFAREFEDSALLRVEDDVGKILWTADDESAI